MHRKRLPPQRRNPWPDNLIIVSKVNHQKLPTNVREFGSRKEKARSKNQRILSQIKRTAGKISQVLLL